MKRNETLKITFGEIVLLFRFSVLSFLTFKEKFGKEITECKSLEDQISYFYSAYIAACNYEKIEDKIGYDDFLNLLDDYPENLNALAEALMESSKKKLANSGRM